MTNNSISVLLRKKFLSKSQDTTHKGNLRDKLKKEVTDWYMYTYDIRNKGCHNI